MSVRVDAHGAVRALVVDRPGARNAFDLPAMRAFAGKIAELAADPPRAVVLHGGGGRFISGGDLKALAALRAAPEAEAMSLTMQAALAALAELPIPVIAAVDAYALGGGAEVMLAADLIVATPDARVAFKQVAFGVTTAWGGARRLVQRVGAATARRLLWTGDVLSGADALAVGLVDVLASPGDDARTTALALAQRIASRPAAAVRALDRLVAEAGLPAAAHRALEARLFGQSWASAEHWAAVDRHWAARAARES